MSEVHQKQRPEKPLGRKAYGSTPHLLGSRRGPGDWGVNEGQHRICTEKTRDRHDRIIATEKLDGSCVSIANIGHRIVPLTRAGYRAEDSHFEQHHLFGRWVAGEFRTCRESPSARIARLLPKDWRVVGEWLAQAHGTRYEFPHIPFVAFAIFDADGKRLCWDETRDRCARADIPTPRVMHDSSQPYSIEDMNEAITTSGHGALEQVEGAVWRVERKGAVDFLAKFVVADKVDGKYLPEISGQPPVWNWNPDADRERVNALLNGEVGR